MKTALEQKKYITDRQGRRIGMILPIKEYRELLADLEDLESIRAYDEAVASGERPVPFQMAIIDIEHSRR